MARGADGGGGVNLKAERLNRGLSRADFGRRIGISRETVRLIEAGSQPQAATAKKIADFYDCQVTDIWPVSNNGEAAA